MNQIFPKCFGEYNFPYGGLKEKGNVLYCIDCKVKELCKNKKQEENKNE